MSHIAEVPTKAGHHHGNLREALVDAGLVLLAQHGPSGLTLRKCAALAGVSHAAPAHHFAGLAGLLTAIAARGFTLFSQAMLAQAARAPEEPRARLAAICLGYYEFATANPALFDLMFRQIWSIATEDAELTAAGAVAYGVLVDACAPFVGAGTEPGVVETQVWGLIHGYSALSMSGKLGRNRMQAPLTAVLGLLDKLDFAE